MSGILIGIIDILGHTLLVKQDNKLRKETCQWSVNNLQSTFLTARSVYFLLYHFTSNYYVT